MSSRALMLRAPLIGLVMFALLAALWAALQRIGWALPTLRPSLVGVHGPLMISGVLGTLICMERAVALAALANKPFHWAYFAPLCSGIGGVLLVIAGADGLAKAFVFAGSLGLTLVFAAIVRRHRATYTMVMSLGALAWAAGNLLWWTGQPIFQVVHLWIAFLVLTIVGERLELSRVTQPSPRSQQLFVLAAGLFCVGVALTVVNLEIGVRLAGMGELALALWLLRYDIARRTIRRTGLTRFIAACLLIGYVWLGVGGVLGITSGAVMAGPRYDALLHAILLGYVMSMIFGHAPIIFPALSGRDIAFRGFFYGYLLVLHLSLLLREAGNLALWMTGRMWGGLLNVVAVLLFVAATIYSGLRGSHERH